MARVVYEGQDDEVLVALPYGEILAVRGEPIEIADDVVHGVPPTGVDEDGNRGPDFWPGTSGLLAQDAWSLADPPPADPPPADDEGEADPPPADDAEQTAPGQAAEAKPRRSRKTNREGEA